MDITKLNVYKTWTLGDHSKCWYCGDGCCSTADHFWPKSMGGRLKVRCCRNCNTNKKDLTPTEWIEYIEEVIERLSTTNHLKQLERWKRMKVATETLWDRTKWSVEMNLIKK